MTLSGMVKSGKEARRLVNEKAVKLEGRLVEDITEKFEIINFSDPQQLSIGKKKHFNIVIFLILFFKVNLFHKVGIIDSTISFQITFFNFDNTSIPELTIPKTV